MYLEFQGDHELHHNMHIESVIYTGPPYEEMDGKFYVDHISSLRTITWKDDDDDDDDDDIHLNFTNLSNW